MASALRCSATLAAASIAAASLHHTSTSHQDRFFLSAIPPSPSIGSLGAGLVGSSRDSSGEGGWLNKQPLRLADRFAMTMDAVRPGSPSRMVRADAATAEASTDAAPELVTEFMVEMMCEGCATSVRNKLQTLPGVNDVKTNVTDQTVRITGTESLKSLLKALEETGRSSRLIGQGSLEEFEISAAVAEFKGPVLMGVLRIAQVTKDTARVEGQFDGLTPGPHAVFLNQYGDLTRGAASTGGIYTDEGREAGFLGVAQADESGHAELSTATVPLRVYDLIGRALVVSMDEKVSTDNAFAAVVARSAGVGQNLKSLCSCDGTVIWEAQQDRVK